jgi:hypothetical protein
VVPVCSVVGPHGRISSDSSRGPHRSGRAFLARPMVTAEEDSEVRSLHFCVEPGGEEVVCDPDVAIIAGYTGRDRDAVLDHIAELEEIGVAPPPSVPTFYTAPPQLISQAAVMVTTEPGTSGEAEVGLIVGGGEILVTVASDHTDRAAERFDIALSKRLCNKAVATSAWRLDDVIDHWDSLQLRSWLGDDGADLYQDGTLEELLLPSDLLAAIPWRTAPERFLLLCGTVPTIGGLRLSSRFKAQLYDPVTDRKLGLEYRVEVRDLLVPAVAAD